MILNGEIDNRRGSAERGRPRTGFERVGRGRAAERQFQMRMGVHPARDDQFSGSIDYFVGVNDEILADEHNGRTVYKNIRLVVIDRRHNPAIFDQDAHNPSPILSLAG